MSVRDGTNYVLTVTDYYVHVHLKELLRTDLLVDKEREKVTLMLTVTTKYRISSSLAT